MLLKWRKAKGFTLVELMVVVAIIALLAAMAIPQFVKLRTKAMRAEAILAAGSANKAQQAYLSGADKFYTGCNLPPSTTCIPNSASVNDILGLGPLLTPHYTHSWSSVMASLTFSTNYALQLSANLLPPDSGGYDWIDQVGIYVGPSTSMLFVACSFVGIPEGLPFIIEDEITQVDNCISVGG